MKKFLILFVFILMLFPLIIKSSFASEELLSSDAYEIKNNRVYVIPTSNKFTGSELANNVAFDNSLEIYKDDTKLKMNDSVGTGSKVKVNNKYIDVVLLGDLTDDGKISLGDVSALYNHYKNNKVLTGLRLEAGKLSNDSNVTLGDVSKLYNFYKGNKPFTYYSDNVVIESNENLNIELLDAKAGDVITKSFSVTNKKRIEDEYKLYLSEVLNTFTNKDDLVYSLNSDDANIHINNKVVPSKELELVSGSIPGNTTYNFELKIKCLDKTEKGIQVLAAKISLNSDKFQNNMPNINQNVNVDTIVKNVEELKNIDATVGQIIETKGYYEFGDDGKAYYTIEEKNKQTIDNGKYIELNNGLVANLMSIDSSYNLKQFGAKGDSVSDDTNAIKNFVKYANNGFLYVPSGTYMISESIHIYNKSSFGIIGEGESSTIKAMEGIPKITMFYFKDIENAIMSNITFNGNIEKNPIGEVYNDQGGISEVDIWGSKNVTLDECNFVENAYVAVRLIIGEKYDGNYDLVASNNKFYMVDCGIEALGAGNIYDSVIKNNYFEGHDSSEPIALFGNGCTYDNIVIDNNVLKNVKNASAIYAGGNGDENPVEITNLTVTNNSIENFNGTGIYLGYVDGAVVSNNSTYEAGIGMQIRKSNNVEIFDNTVERSKRQGVYFNEVSNINFYDNTIIDSGWANNDFYFMDIRGSNTNLNVYQNTLERKDNDLYHYLMILHGDGGVKVYNNNLINGKIVLYTDSSNMYVANNNCDVLDRGTNNTVIID